MTWESLLQGFVLRRRPAAFVYDPRVSSPLAAPEPWDLVASAYAEEAVPRMEHFAREALRLADLRPSSRIVDVAAGPGTLTRLAARAGHDVVAIDFSPLMIAELQGRLRAEGLSSQVDARQGDGQRLAFADASFDAGFSMFGLMFFPDRDAGLRELFRVVRPGTPVIVSSWGSPDRFPHTEVAFAAMAELFSRPNSQPARAPLAREEDCIAEMSAAGFEAVVVHEVTYESQFASMKEYWAEMTRTSVPFALCKEMLGEVEWEDVSTSILDRLQAAFGDGVQTVKMPANVIVGRRRA